ncbi:MAG: phosphoribosylformylglycinamidine synthase subunit PurL [Solirubrobacterales bacterium]|nr:phosphoribosylformylglycinamidine synthase subunit PurL [Solirubrobacterales bacterium]
MSAQQAESLPGVDRAVELGLTKPEYARIVELIGREPNEVELAMFSLLWSEHCAYKHSKKVLRRLPTEGDRLLMGVGENAGAVEVAGLAVAFKVESHNHPSAVEPFQGAATGVGGILRDVIALGARPIAMLNSLRFGHPSSPRSRWLLDRAVAGIGHYGNSIGVATVGGEIHFDPSYESNCLINAMCVGIADPNRLMRCAATGVGNRVILFGALTGRDGIGGASVLASAELGDDDADKRPTVQIGDPFAEKKVLEASLELIDADLLVALQDLGAAGLTSSASEMAAQGGVGLDIDVARVPLREQGMEPFEIMVSESQERMLAIVEPSKVAAVLEVCERWELLASDIGEVTEGDRMRILVGDDVVGDIPVTTLVDDCPLYDLAPAPPEQGLYPAPPADLPDEADHRDTLVALLGGANIASRRPVFQQYDQIVQARTVRRPDEADAAVLALPVGEDGIRPAIAVSIDGNARRVAANPEGGALEAVLECAANLACVGAEPLGLTNCLNFGNPEKPHVAWQLINSVEGIAVGCEALGIPVVGGNVSLYNEGPDGPILPTPVIGMVGEMPDATKSSSSGFTTDGQAVALVGPFVPNLVSSELAARRGHAPQGELPSLDIGAVIAAHHAVRDGVRSGAIQTAHDISEGGLGVALAECTAVAGVGCEVTLPEFSDAALFGESPGQGFVIAGDPAAIASIPGARVVGTTGGGDLVVSAEDGASFSVPVAEVQAARDGGLTAYLP